jgi:hypothetical protein
LPVATVPLTAFFSKNTGVFMGDSRVFLADQLVVSDALLVRPADLLGFFPSSS